MAAAHIEHNCMQEHQLKELEFLRQENRALRDVLRHTSILLEQRNREYALFRLVVDTVGRAISEPNSLKRILQHIVELLGAENGSIMLLDDSRQELSVSAASGTKDLNPSSTSIAAGHGVAGWVLERGETVFLLDVGLDPRFMDLGRETHIRSLLCMPIIHEGEIVGVLNLSHSRPGAISEDVPRFLDLILPQIAQAIRNIDSINVHADRAEILFRKNRELEDANRRLADTQREFVKVERLKAISELAISMNHEINNPLTAVLGDAQLLLSLPQADDPIVRFHLQDIRQQCFRVGEILEKVRNMEQAVSTDYADGLRMLDLERSSATLPVFERVQDSYYALLRESVERWEEQSRYWRGHSARVCDLACRMGIILNLPQDEIQTLQRLAGVWNVGVLTVDEQILLKAETLSVGEAQIIENRMKISRSLLEPLCVTIFSNRERPTGRPSERTSYYAPTELDDAILRIANAFVALISDRPHRAAFSPDAALAKLNSEEGAEPLGWTALQSLCTVLDIAPPRINSASA